MPRIANYYMKPFKYATKVILQGYDEMKARFLVKTGNTDKTEFQLETYEVVMKDRYVC